MRPIEDYEARARNGRAFSSSADRELWEHRVCLGSGYIGAACRHHPCPLIELAQHGRIPAEWRLGAAPGCAERTTYPWASPPAATARPADEAAAQAATDDQGSLFDI